MFYSRPFPLVSVTPLCFFLLADIILSLDRSLSGV